MEETHATGPDLRLSQKTAWTWILGYCQKPEVLVMTVGSGVEVGVISHAPGLLETPLNLPCWTMTLLSVYK